MSIASYPSLREIAESSRSTRFRARRGQVGYGFSVGILMMEAHVPFAPGDVGNASTYDFPVLFQPVSGTTFEGVIYHQDPSFTPLFVESAKKLAKQGVRAITGDCAYMGVYQRAVADAIDIPVFLSSLMQVPMILNMLRTQDKLAILVASGSTVSDRLIKSVNIDSGMRERCIFRGLSDKEHFNDVILNQSGELDTLQLENEMVQTAREVIADEPNVRAFLFECSDMPPYSAAVQRATGLPVFDWIGFINYVHHAVVSKTYSGFF